MLLEGQYVTAPHITKHRNSVKCRKVVKEMVANTSGSPRREIGNIKNTMSMLMINALVRYHGKSQDGPPGTSTQPTALYSARDKKTIR